MRTANTSNISNGSYTFAPFTLKRIDIFNDVIKQEMITASIRTIRTIRSVRTIRIGRKEWASKRNHNQVFALFAPFEVFAYSQRSSECIELNKVFEVFALSEVFALFAYSHLFSMENVKGGIDDFWRILATDTSEWENNCLSCISMIKNLFTLILISIYIQLRESIWIPFFIFGFNY